MMIHQILMKLQSNFEIQMLALVVIFGCEYEMVWFPLIFAHGSLLSFLMVFIEGFIVYKICKEDY